jgi:hypothetical protein
MNNGAATCICGETRDRHVDGEDGDRVNERTPRGVVTVCTGFHARKTPPVPDETCEYCLGKYEACPVCFR